jgi:predicted DNA-binding transcriptional regulator AlpA
MININRLWDNKDIAEYFAISVKEVEENINKNSGFPKPLNIAGFNRWKPNEIIEWKHNKTVIAIAPDNKKLGIINKELSKKEKELKILNKKISELQISLSRYSALAPYPDIPLPSITPKNSQYPDLKNKSGIYFIWLDGIIMYVGQSTNLDQRLRFKSHSQIKSKEERISVLLFDSEILKWAEFYYIGLARPMRNYGSHKNKKSVSF